MNSNIFQCTREQSSPEDGIIEGLWYASTGIVILGPYASYEEAEQELKDYKPLVLK